MHNIQHTKHHITLVVFIIGVVALLILLVWPNAREKPASFVNDTAGVIEKAVYQCADGKSITAVYREGSVALELSDLRAITLPQAISASGARYATPDEHFVFWNKGNTAFIQENNALTFTDCATSETP
ncbi:MAG: MliC family protein [Patescibacteria group bacterium]